MLSLTDIQHAYAGQIALRLPELALQAGEQLAVVGPSGCGKTTLLHIIAGLLQPTQGTVCLAGQNLASLSASERDRFRGRHLGIVFQRLHLLGALSVRQNLQLAQKLAGVQVDTVAVDQLLASLDLLPYANAKPAQLSVGQAQRVAVARALVNRPALLLADEPTSSLDAANAERVLDILREHAREAQAALLVVTHDQRLQGGLDREIALEPIA